MAVSINIKDLYAREILDSRGNPTLEIVLTTASGVTVCAGVPSGASIGTREALDLRDNDSNRYAGKGVLKAINNVNHKIAPRLTGKTFSNPQSVDKVLLSLDATLQKNKLGGNAMIGVSLASARAFASEAKIPLYRYLQEVYKFQKIESLPTPMMNIFNGGKHADTNLDVQEIMIVPLRKKLLSEKIRMGAEIFYALKNVLQTSGFDADTGDEGGYAPDIHATIEAIRMILLATKDAGYVPGKDVSIAFDIGANTLYDINSKQYRFKLDANFFSAHQLIALYEIWQEQFSILSIEDGLHEDDWDNWTTLHERLGKDMLIVGDDLFTSSVTMLKKGIAKNAANTIIIKPNQIGTLTEAIETVHLAQENNMKVIVSHRSGETNDDFVADLAVAVSADYIKCGAPNRGERVAKYNRLLAIEDELMQS